MTGRFVNFVTGLRFHLTSGEFALPITAKSGRRLRSSSGNSIGAVHGTDFLQYSVKTLREISYIKNLRRGFETFTAIRFTMNLVHDLNAQSAIDLVDQDFAVAIQYGLITLILSEEQKRLFSGRQQANHEL
ncbi:hypothetical protein SIIN_5451_T [Serendipita indica DSM 11827]|nr:hypothetical protein SIIN_5451_T [Serendipita indica DSM 11827]